MADTPQQSVVGMRQIEASQRSTVYVMQHAVAQKLSVDAWMFCDEEEQKRMHIHGHGVRPTHSALNRGLPVLLQNEHTTL